MRGKRIIWASLLAAGVAALVLTTGAPARHSRGVAIKPIVVNTTADVLSAGDGKTSLREAIDQANATTDEVQIILPARQVIALTICGNGADDDGNKQGDLDHYGGGGLTISGNGSTIRQTCEGARVIHQLGTALLNLTDMTVAGGHAVSQPGGGIFVAGGGELQLKNDIVTGNRSDAAGGGVATFGPASVTGTTIALNQATELGGGIAPIGPLTLVRSVVSGNTAPFIGGIAGSGPLQIAYSTVQDNSMPNMTGSSLTAFATVIGVPKNEGGNPPPGVPAPPIHASCSISQGPAPGKVTSLGYNFDNDGSCGFGAGPGDKSNGGNPGLAPAQGSGTPLIVPQKGSPLIDAIPASACIPSIPWIPSWSPLTTDIRGLARPQGAGCDIGAVEVGSVAKKACLTVTPTTLRRSVRAKVTVRLNSSPSAGVRITLAGAGISTAAQTARNGLATFHVVPRKSGRIVVAARRAGCRAVITVR